MRRACWRSLLRTSRTFLVHKVSPAKGYCVVPVYFEDVVKVLDCPVAVPFVRVCVAPVSERLRVIRAQTDGLIIILDCPIESTLSLVCYAPVDSRLGLQQKPSSEVLHEGCLSVLVVRK